jgi:Tol biopolymer transport system component
MTRKTLVLLAATAMVVLLAGCGSSKKEDQGSSHQEVDSSQQTSEPTTNETLVGRCADSNSTGGQQEEASGSEVSNGKIAFERSNADGYSDIYVIDEEGTHETRLTRTPQSEQGPVWSPDREKIAFARNSRGIYVMDADGANLTRLTGIPSEAWSAKTLEDPVWSPDGGKLAFVTGGGTNDGLSVMNADGTNRTQFQPKLFTPPDKSFGYGTYKTVINVDSLVWSPTGNKLAFGSYTELFSDSSADSSASAQAPVEGSTGIYLINVDGTGLCKLTGSHDEKAFGMYPVWSPDGGKLAFQDDGMINVINHDGSGRKELTGTVGAQFAPAWSPDGQEIAYTANSALYVINADGTGREKLAVGAGSLAKYAWSPDGQKIAFFCDDGSSLCAINADGTERTQLTREIFDSGYPGLAAWGSG